MPTLAELKRCPKCKSADLMFPWQRGTLPDCWHCHSCLENFDAPITLAPMTPSPANPSGQTLRELIAKWRANNIGLETGDFNVQLAIAARKLQGRFCADELEALLPAIESARLDVAGAYEAVRVAFDVQGEEAEKLDALTPADARAALDSLIAEKVQQAVIQSALGTQEAPCGTAEIAGTSTKEVSRHTAKTALPTEGHLLEWQSLSKESQEKVSKWFELAVKHLQNILDSEDLDSLIERAIERCAREADQYKGSPGDVAQRIRAITPASVREESHRAK